MEVVAEAPFGNLNVHTIIDYNNPYLWYSVVRLAYNFVETELEYSRG